MGAAIAMLSGLSGDDLAGEVAAEELACDEETEKTLSGDKDRFRRPLMRRLRGATFLASSGEGGGELEGALDFCGMGSFV